jgi:DNA mismatch repair protein MutS
LAGFPHHALDTYLPKLVRAGQRVAICDQLEDPKLTKGIVKRGITELVTPGVILSDTNLDNRENNFLAAVYFGQRDCGAAFLDMSTGEFFAAYGKVDYIDRLMSNLSPKEVIYPRGKESCFVESFGNKYYSYKLEDWIFSAERGAEKLMLQFDVRSLKGYGIESSPEAIAAAGAILYYLDFTEHKLTGHITSISRIDQDKYVWLDKFTVRNLELFNSNSVDGKSFAQVIDRTVTPMGARMLKRFIALPLRNVDDINERLDMVEKLIGDGELRSVLTELTIQIGDMERIISKVATCRVLPREIVQLKTALDSVEKIAEVLRVCGHKRLQELSAQLNPCTEIRERIAREIYPDPSNQIQKGGVIADGVSEELDELRKIAMNGKAVLADIQERESQRTGIPSLKISYNNVFGYYIEVRNTHKDKVPESWIRKQTLTGAERYITEELKEYEQKIMGAEERIIQIETEIYNALVSYISQHLAVLQRDAHIVARVDCLQSFAAIARERRYVRPVVDDSTVLDIKDGRHPVIETLMPIGEEYVPNDVQLDNDNQQIIIITGPNMSGKSALLRQTALIVLMAQMGSFVPARAAHIGVVDKIFTRVGASDNLSEGESTFMVEMLESASILNNISERSLVLLDEIGRGTSTYDGISIAWAMVEYLHNNSHGAAKTLFATHYHELNELENMLPRVKNYHVTVKEIEKTIVFLRKLVRGGTEHSFGIHVARMSGMPREVVQRAEAILANLEKVYGSGEIVPSGSIKQRGKRHGVAESAAATKDNIQLSMFQLDDPVLVAIRDQIKGLDINSLTPLEALNKLNEIKRITGL